jgi:hypothetical protein
VRAWRDSIVTHRSLLLWCHAEGCCKQRLGPVLPINCSTGA